MGLNADDIFMEFSMLRYLFSTCENALKCHVACMYVCVYASYLYDQCYLKIPHTYEYATK